MPFQPTCLVVLLSMNLGGGEPRTIKEHIFNVRKANDYSKKWGHPEFHIPWHSRFGQSPLDTSEGALKTKLRVAAEELGRTIGPHDYEAMEKLMHDLNSSDILSLNVAAGYLHDLILHDYPGTNTRNLTAEQFMLAGIRYNRGTQRNKNDLISGSALAEDPTGDPKQDNNRKYTSYGRSMWWEHRAHVRMLLGLFDETPNHIRDTKLH
jgi:hypothetical protein